MDLQTLLGDMPKSRFVEDFFHRFPLSIARAAQPFCELGTWEALGEILAQPNADVLVAKEDQQFPGPPPTNLDSARAFSRDGYTVLVRHAERHSAPLRHIAEDFGRAFSSPVNIHMYATPPGHHGFGWHFDAEDVFIIQTGGAKEYSLRKNTVHPWPLVETIPDDMRYPREIMPLMRVRLNAGDWLYIPCGYWHKADAIDTAEPALSLAIGVMSPSAMDVYDFARTHLLQSLVWRQRLPVRGTASAASDEEQLAYFRELFEHLAADFRRTICNDRYIQSFLERLSPNGEASSLPPPKSSGNAE